MTRRRVGVCIWGACAHQFWRGGFCVDKRDIKLSDMSTQTYNSW